MNLNCYNTDLYMPRLHLAVLTTKNETWRLWKQLSKF